MDSGVHSTLHSKLNLKFDYPPCRMHKIWEYNRSETVSNNHSIESFDRSNLFSGKNVHEEGELFKKTLLRFFHNFIPK